MDTATDARTTADQIISLERAALDRWGNGDPGGFLELDRADMSYFDPLTAARIDGHHAMRPTAARGPARSTSRGTRCSTRTSWSTEQSPF